MSSDQEAFGKMYSPFESRAIVVGGLIAIAWFLLKGTDPQLVEYFWMYLWGYLGLSVALTLRAYCRKRTEKKKEHYAKLLA